jgi:hypothetical protein
MPIVAFVPALIAWGFAALGAAGVNVFGNSQSNSWKPATTPNPTPSPSPGPRPVTPGTQTFTVPSTAPSPTFNRGNFSITPASGSGNRGSSSSPAPAANAPAPAPAQSPEPQSPPPPPPDPPTYRGVKAAPIDTVVFIDEPFDENFFADVLFQDFGGQELLSIARSDTVNGQDVAYQPFKDLGIIRDQYSPNNLLAIQETSDRFFANFLIRLNEKIPNVGNGPNGSNFYFDLDTGDGIIELINIESNEQVEIQILNAGIIEDIGI